MEGNRNADIFVYSHVSFSSSVNNEPYKILTNSKEGDGKFDGGLKIYRDNTGDNIADMNLMYNEYTGLYWIWKNWKLKDYVGLNHYSRYYFCGDHLPDFDDIFNEQEHSMIINEPVMLLRDRWYTNRTWYGKWHCLKDYELLREVVLDMHPDYEDGWKRMEKANYCYNSSMFVMRNSDFKEYCNFIFPILEEVRKRRGWNTDEDCTRWVDEHKSDYIKEGQAYYNVRMQARIVGYLAERAMNTYIMNGGRDSMEAAAFRMPIVTLK